MKLFDQLKQKSKKLKSEIQVLIIAYSKPRTPLLAKILIWITVGYLLSPIDLIPDFIPILGLLDDLVIVPLLISLSIKLIPQAVLSEARLSVQENSEKLKKNNWIFGILIIVIWLLTLNYIYIKVIK